jgi:drug/metabolite transporter (DMT)-like permease
LKALRFLLKGSFVTNPHSDWTLTNFWRTRQTFIAEMTFVVVVFFWGITFVFSKAALEVVGPFAYNTMRMTLATLTLALLVGRDWRHVNRSYFWPALVTGFILFLSYATQAYGIQFTTASKAGFLTGTNLVYVPIFSALLLRRIPSWTAITGVALAFVGLYLISFEGALGNLSLSHGDLWVAISGVGWALYLIALSNYSPRLNTVLFSALHVGVTALLSGIGWVFSAEPLTLPLTSSALWLAAISTGVLVIGLGTSVETWVARLVSPTRLALIAALEPVFAALAGWWVGETITLRIITGGALILAGMLVAESKHILNSKRASVPTEV